LRAPGRLNAVSEAQHGELARVWQAIGQDEETRAVLVRGADGAFSSGGDLDLVLAIADDADIRQRVFHEARDLVYNMLRCPTPIVSAITGPAVGAGLVVGLLADVSLASPQARIVDGHTKLGVAAREHAAIGRRPTTRRSSARCCAGWRRRSTTCCCARRSTVSRRSGSGSSRFACRRRTSR